MTDEDVFATSWYWHDGTKTLTEGYR